MAAGVYYSLRTFTIEPMMSLTPADLHLLLNHIPILGTVFLVILLAAGLGRSRDVTTVALVLTVVLSLVGIGTYLTGEPAEHYIRKTAWFDHDVAHEHEENAERATIVLGVTGALAFVGLWRRRTRPEDQLFPRITMAGLLVSAGLMAWAGRTGGKIRHAEEIEGRVPAAAAEHEGDGGHEHD